MNFNRITRLTSRTAVRIKRNSPQILFYAGITGTVVTTVLASRATLKAVPVMEKLRSERAELEQFAAEGRVEKADFHEVATSQYVEAGVQLTKLYGPVVIVGVASLAALTKSHRELISRNSALTVAYTGLFKTFEKYRERVRAEVGSDIDQKFLHGTVMQTVEVEGKNGTKTKELAVLDPNSEAALSYYFDDRTRSWCKDPTYNQSFLEHQQMNANYILQKQGHLFLNEVYDMLMIEHTAEGQILGWLSKDVGDNDTFVDFGFNADGEFVAGFKRDVMLNFNIHGPILDEI